MSIAKDEYEIAKVRAADIKERAGIDFSQPDDLTALVTLVGQIVAHRTVDRGGDVLYMMEGAKLVNAIVVTTATLELMMALKEKKDGQ